MRWAGQQIDVAERDALPGLARLNNLVRTVRTPEFAGVTFYEVLARSALNHVPGAVPGTPYGWTINPYRGCTHACVYCFARPTHRYLDFADPGDFDRELVVKINVADVLRDELRKPSWARPVVALGTNTDPYQRAEGRYRLMPGVLEALAASGTPFSLLTKGSLLRRDVPLLARCAEQVRVEIAVSIAIYDDALQQAVEPGTPTTTARLETVRAAREAGLTCGVFLMPVLPFLTDSVEHLDGALRRIAEAGASSVTWSTLYLKPGFRDWFLAWLRRERPDLEGSYRALYGAGAYAPRAYREELGRRIRPLVRRYGLAVGRSDLGTGGPVAAAPRPAPQPTLF